MLYKSLWAILRFIFLGLGLKSEGLDNIPLQGPVIIASNHVSNWDPIMVALVLKRPVHFIAKASLFKNAIANKFFTALHAFPVKRGVPDRKAIRKALQVLKDGNVLGIFPEGARNNTGALKGQAGVALIALRSGAPIVPVACIGTKRILPIGWFKPLLIRVGKPIYLDEFRGHRVGSEGMGEISSAIMLEIDELLHK